MLVHSVYFWLKDGLTCDDLSAFRAGLEALSEVPSVRALYVGTPAAAAERPVIDQSYTFGLTVLCDDLAGQESYQVSPAHQAFVETFSSMWDKIIVYDAD